MPSRNGRRAVRGLVVAATAAALTTAATVPANAVGVWHGARHVGATGCRSAHLAPTSSTLQRGFIQCGSKIVYIEGDGTKAWRSKSTGLTGDIAGVGAVADDGINTYVVYAQNNLKLLLAIRSHTGSIHHQVLMTYPSRAYVRAAVVASGGKWWADWANINYANDVWQAHTLHGTQKPTKTNVHWVNTVELALIGTKPVMAWNNEEGVGLYVGYPKSKATWSQSTVANREAFPFSLVIDGGRPAVAYVTTDSLNREQVAYSKRNATTGWSTKRLTTGVHRDLSGVVAAARSSTVVVAWPSDIGKTTVEVRRGGAWSKRTISGALEPERAALPKGKALILYVPTPGVHVDSRLES